MMRAKFLIVLFLGVLLVLPTGATRAAPRFEGVQVKFLVSASHRQFDPLWTTKVDQLKRDTGIEVVLTRVPYSDIVSKVLQDLALGSGRYDIMEIPDVAIATVPGYLESLNRYVVRDFGSLGKWSAQLAPWSVRSATWGGALKYWPHYAGETIGAYRKDLLENPRERDAFKKVYGYDLPTPPKTLKELRDVAQFFTRKNLYGLVFGGGTDSDLEIYEEFLFRAGVTYFDKQNRSLWGAAHPENRKVVADTARFLQDLVNKWKVTPSSVPAMGTTESLKAYMSGQAAMIIDLIYFGWTDLKSADVVSQIGESVSFEVPAAKKGTGGEPFFWMLGISKGSNNKEAAWAVLKWFNDPENLRYALQNGKGVFVPTNKTVADWAAETGILPPAVVSAVKGAQFYYLHPRLNEVRETIMRDRIQAVIAGQLSPEKFAEETGRLIDQLLGQ